MIKQVKSCKGALSNLVLQSQKYRITPDKVPVQSEVTAALDKSMVTISEALIARGLQSRDPASEVRAQLGRMANQKVGQVHVQLLAAANQVVVSAAK